MKFDGLRVLIIGMARSGEAAAKALYRRGAAVSICDRKSTADLGDKINTYEKMGITVYTGGYPQVTRENFELIIASPGVPFDIDPFVQARAENITVIGEVELAYILKPEKVEFLAITGTNGKTTTTALLEAIIAADGKISVAGGNIGVPLTSLIDVMNEGVISVEMSSFQLETIRDFHPHVCGLLNITPDHLDRHKSMQNYIETKARIFSNQTRDDYAVLNYDDRFVRNLTSLCPAKIVYFSTSQPLEKGVYIKNGIIIVNINNDIQKICHTDDVCLRGQHNLENILCAVGMALLAGVAPSSISRTLRAFKGVRHRMEEVVSYNGILYVNDSKATNPESAIKALESFHEPIVLIAGGRNKGSDFSILAGCIKDRVKEMVLLGEARQEIKTAVQKAGFKNIHEAEDFSAAVGIALHLACSGDVVLLSPACASWDMFDNYEQRGNLFCELVRTMVGNQ